MKLAGQIDAFGIGQLLAAVRFEGIFFGDHDQESGGRVQESEK